MVMTPLRGQMWPLGQQSKVPVPAWTPADKSLAFWLRGDLGRFEDDGFVTPANDELDVVGGWQDQSGNTRHATTSVTARKPTLDLASSLNQDALNFAGDDALVTPTISHGIGTGDYTYGAVFRAVSVTGYRALYGNGDGGFAPAFYVLNGKLSRYHGGDKLSAGSILVNTNYAVLFVRSGGTLRFYINSTTADANTHADVTSFLTSVGVIGADSSGGGDGFSGLIAEEMLDNEAWSVDDIAGFFSYCASRYGI